MEKRGVGKKRRSEGSERNGEVRGMERGWREGGWREMVRGVGQKWRERGGWREGIHWTCGCRNILVVNYV